MSATLDELRAAWERDRDECGECYIRRPHETAWHLCAYHDGYEDALDRLAALEAPKGTPLEWAAGGSGRVGPLTGQVVHWDALSETPEGTQLYWEITQAASDRFTLRVNEDSSDPYGVWLGQRLTLQAAQTLAARLADVLGSES